MFNWGSEALGSVNQALEFRYNAQATRAKTRSAIGEADILLDNAKSRLAAGTRQANLARHQGRVVESDAIAAMVGQGGGIDINQLAKIKARSNFNAISALFESRTQAADMSVRAASMKTDAARNARLRAQAAEVGAFGNIINLGMRASSASNFGFPASTKIARPPANIGFDRSG